MATMFPIDAALDPVNAFPIEEDAPVAFDEMELVAALKREFEAADSEYERLREYAQLADNYYQAKLFGNEVDGRSQIILPDVQETIDYMAVSVLRTFVSGDRIVEFEATDESDEKAADEATAAIGYNFMRQQDGYRILHDWCVSGLLERIGIAKTMIETQERVVRETIPFSDPVELEGIDGEIEGVEETPEGAVAKLKRTIRQKRSIDVAVPLREFRFSPNARHEDEAAYLAHCPVKTRSDLVDMGFDREQVYGLPAYTRLPDDDREAEYWPEAESTEALQQVMLCEEYARIDIDGDGIAERIKVFRVEGEILRWAVPLTLGGQLAIETVEEQPFSIFCPFPRPHRLVGWSLADKVMDIQLGRSTIARQLLDGMYNANLPRPVIDMTGADENTIDDLLSPIAGAPIRVRNASAITPYQTAFDVGKSLSVMEWFTGERESRTGITRLNQGLDADTLNKTATGTALMQAQGQQQEEFIARNFAEAFARLTAKKYRMMRNEAEPFRMKVDGKYMMVDPSKWPEDMNLTIRVGLGTGSKDKRIQGRMALAPLLAEGFQNGQVEERHLYHAVDGLVRDLGLGKGDDYWKDPDAPPPIDPETGQPVEEQEKPDPAALAMQAEQAREDAKFQAEQQRAQAQLQLDQQKAAAQLQLTREANAANIESQRENHALQMEQAREKAALEAALARDKAQAEADIAIYRIDREAEVKRYAADKNAASGDGIGNNREGGRLDA